MIIKLEDEDETLGDPYLEFSEKTNKEGRSETFLTDCTYIPMREASQLMTG